ncbi:hypothetical protein LX16_0873 [Stackebrandtia albiflava]|uniref:Uncharacterized protein n=1 Tax=Stackebrandtia albiflava TaxID=406432 RepID=A0A562VBC0_9ACTN|nr:hypothetical protein [Stackebrandtia albiflava]TWJ15173.1 hypothetical protein LX16_0873 [Stackebrandtia albiflava]
MTGPHERARELVRRCERIAVDLYALNDHPGLRWADRRPVTGHTAETLAGVRRRVDSAWIGFDALRRHCDTTWNTVTADPQETDPEPVAALLDDPVRVEAAAGTRDLPPADLATELEDAVRELVPECDRIDLRCGRVADRIDRLTSDMAAVEERAGRYDLTNDPDLAALRSSLRPALDAALEDPLAPHPELDPLAERLARVTATLSELDELRTTLPDRLRHIRDAVDALTEAERRALETCTLAVAKIGNPAPRRLRPVAAELAGRVPDTERLAAEHRWHELRPRLHRIETEISEAHARSRAREVAARALLDRRAELRGRFAAYARKGARIGVIETEPVAEAMQQARALLQSTPCDLPAATRALNRFQQAVTATAAKEGTR